jgi:hypothetical protein
MRRLTTRELWTVYRDVLARRESFTTSGALRGLERPSTVALGRLPREWHTSALRADYVVYSYGTPIAWHGPSGWVMPDERYSMTTSHHQGRIRPAISTLTDGAYIHAVTMLPNRER